VAIKKLFIHSEVGAAAGASHQVCAEYYSKPGFVYDLETDNHHFHVGPGRMVVHNTDSIMFTLPGVPRDEVFTKGPELAKGASALFEKPIKLEFEKVMEQYMLLKKKNYAGMMRTCIEDKGKLMAKGIASERRDNCSLVRTTMKKVLGAVMIDRDPTKAFGIVKSVLDNLKSNTISIEELGITMSLKPEDSYVDPNGHAQLNVVRKMIARGAFNVPRPGDRVEYVIIESQAEKVSDRAEDPLFVVKNNIKLDRLYYLNNQLRTPILKIMEVLPVPSVKKLFEAAEADLGRQRLGVGRVTDFFASAAPPSATDMPPRSYTLKSVAPPLSTPKPAKKQKLVQSNLTF
jgi:DNA polymerase elongation subunit (family B)